LRARNRFGAAAKPAQSFARVTKKKKRAAGVGVS